MRYAVYLMTIILVFLGIALITTGNPLVLLALPTIPQLIGNMPWQLIQAQFMGEDDDLDDAEGAPMGFV